MGDFYGSVSLKDRWSPAESESAIGRPGGFRFARAWEAGGVGRGGSILGGER